MVHVVDGIEVINLITRYRNREKGVRGRCFAGLDPVATDLLAARYMFSNVPLKDALAVGMDDGSGDISRRSSRRPLSKAKTSSPGSTLIAAFLGTGPLGQLRRGFGKRKYYVVDMTYRLIHQWFQSMDISGSYELTSSRT